MHPHTMPAAPLMAVGPYRVEPLTADDLAEVVEIDRLSFNPPWPASAYRQELEANRLARYLVLRRSASSNDSPASGSILGYAGLWVYLGEAHLTTIAVRPEERGKGLGELLLLSCIDLAWRLGAASITLEVRASNGVAQALYQKYGFQEVGRRRAYYAGDREDALLLTLFDLDTKEYRARLARLRAALWQRLGASSPSR